MNNNIPLIYKQIFYKYFVCLFDGMLRYLWMSSSLLSISFFCSLYWPLNICYITHSVFFSFSVFCLFGLLFQTASLSFILIYHILGEDCKKNCNVCIYTIKIPSIQNKPTVKHNIVRIKMNNFMTAKLNKKK